MPSRPARRRRGALPVGWGTALARVAAIEVHRRARRCPVVLAVQARRPGRGLRPGTDRPGHGSLKPHRILRWRETMDHGYGRVPSADRNAGNPPHLVESSIHPSSLSRFQRERTLLIAIGAIRPPDHATVGSGFDKRLRPRALRVYSGGSTSGPTRPASRGVSGSPRRSRRGEGRLCRVRPGCGSLVTHGVAEHADGPGQAVLLPVSAVAGVGGRTGASDPEAGRLDVDPGIGRQDCGELLGGGHGVGKTAGVDQGQASRRPDPRPAWSGPGPNRDGPRGPACGALWPSRRGARPRRVSGQGEGENGQADSDHGPRCAGIR